MNAEILEKTDLDTIFPEGKTVKIPRPGGKIEELHIMPMPLKKWKKGIWYITRIAPLLGFDLMAKDTPENDTAAYSNPSSPQVEQLKDKLFGLMLDDSDESNIVLEFLAFAINKDVEFLESLYDEVIDIALAVIEVNIVFFFQRLLPKILAGSKEVTAITLEAKALLAKSIRGRSQLTAL